MRSALGNFRSEKPDAPSVHVASVRAAVGEGIVVTGRNASIANPLSRDARGDESAVGDVAFTVRGVVSVSRGVVFAACGVASVSGDASRAVETAPLGARDASPDVKTTSLFVDSATHATRDTSLFYRKRGILAETGIFAAKPARDGAFHPQTRSSPLDRAGWTTETGRFPPRQPY